MRLCTRLVRAAGSALAVSVFGASAAQAGTVEVWSQEPGWGVTAATGVRFEAASGEVNRLRVLAEPKSLMFVDEGAPIDIVGGGCTQNTPHQVTCPRLQLSVNLGDGDDSFSGQAVTVVGGEGDDRVLISGGTADGGPGADMLEGSPTDDVFVGGPGNDIVKGGPGDDRVVDTGAEIEADQYDGGGGRDQVTYATQAGFEVDLRRPAPNGRPGENDTLVSVEGITAEGAAARLVGTDRAEVFYLSGRSRRTPSFADAGGGNDEIHATGPSPDRLIAGSGHDTIQLDRFDFSAGEPFMADNISCGQGTDLVEEPDPLTVIPDDCERVTDGYTEWGSFWLHLPMRSLRARLVEARADYGCTPYDQCRIMTLSIRRSRDGRPTGPVLGRARAREWRPLDLRLNEAGRRILRRRGAFRAVVKLAGQREGPFAFTTRVGLDG